MRPQDWYTRSLAIEEELGDRSGMAGSYHELGIVARAGGGWRRPRTGTPGPWPSRRNSVTGPGWRAATTSSAGSRRSGGGWMRPQDWYTRSLAISEELGDRPGMASSYHQLGIVAQDRGRLDEAEDWYTRSLTISEEVGDRSGMASSYHELGRVAIRRRQARGGRRTGTPALWPSARKSAIDPRWQLPTRSSGRCRDTGKSRAGAGMGSPVRGALRRSTPSGNWAASDSWPVLTHQLGTRALEACWQQVTDDPLPDTVRHYVRSYRPDTGDTSEGADR